MSIEDIEISKLTKQQLLIKCDELEIKKCKSKNKSDIINLIKQRLLIQEIKEEIKEEINEEIKKNNYYIGDNIKLLNSIRTEEIDLIYFDPTYNTGRNFYDFDDKFKN